MKIQAADSNQRGKRIKSLIFERSLLASNIFLVCLLVAMFIALLIGSIPAIKHLGFGFLYNKVWDPVSLHFGALSFLVGTLLTSFLALLISIPFSIAVGLYLGEYYRKGALSDILKSAIELLAGVPSIIYGFWGLFVLVPIIRVFETEIGVAPYGVGIFASSLVLAIMIIPYSASLAREVITLTPGNLKEAAYSLGATRYEVIRDIILPYTRSGIFAGMVLALGRALGETMAVTMVIGNANMLPKSIFSPSNTIASVIANEFNEATNDVYLSVLVELGLLLFLVTTIINIIGRRIIVNMNKIK